MIEGLPPRRDDPIYLEGELVGFCLLCRDVSPSLDIPPCPACGRRFRRRPIVLLLVPAIVLGPLAGAVYALIWG